MEFLDTILGILAPHICVGCGQEGPLLCRACSHSLPAPDERNPLAGLDSVRAVTAYNGLAKDLVWQLKFRGARAASGVMARHMAPYLRTDDPRAVIMPVPTATRRVRQRGFDQAKLLARQLSRLTGLRYMDCLRRYGQTHQVGASREQRLSQLGAAYHLKPGLDLKDCRIILVDDVLTTGATLETAATVVRAAGARRIDAVVFAQAD